MRILFIINSLGAGGAERSLAETLAFPNDLQAVVACLIRERDGMETQVVDSGAEVRSIAGRSLLGQLRRVRTLTRESCPDLVHTTIFESDVIGRFAAAGMRVPVLTSLVNTSYDPVRLQDPAVNAWKLQAARGIDGWTARHLTTHFHAISNAVKDAAVRDLRIHPDRVTVIERGRDPERLGKPSPERRSRARRALLLEGGNPVVVTVGRQEFQKGQWYLLEAFPQVLAAHPDATLLLAGRPGNASRRIEEVERSAAFDGRIRILGHRDDIPEILAAADVFVFPSLYEGLGGALIEAMALGLPIIGSDLPAIREVVEADRNAVLVPAGSPAALAAAVSALADDPMRRRAMGTRSRQIFEERFTLERSATRLLDLFERVAATGSRPQR